MTGIKMKICFTISGNRRLSRLMKMIRMAMSSSKINATAIDHTSHAWFRSDELYPAWIKDGVIVPSGSRRLICADSTIIRLPSGPTLLVVVSKASSTPLAFALSSSTSPSSTYGCFGSSLVIMRVLKSIKINRP
ncbi:hypothetical protein D3C84_1036600 [compost metagenome]